ncbi:MAG: Soluble lytic murein transglycosylase [Nitrospira sp.]|jgi:soluble lytic murein transglycosylase-like protein|nr:MAG: Soluble lytic murein transglycosylase [Nitrospira sp.]
MEIPTEEASGFCRSSQFDTMLYPDRNPRWIHAARAFGPLLVAGCLTVLMPSVSQFPPDSGLTDQNGSRSPEPISSLVATHAKHYGLDPALLRAVIKVESNFNPQAVSSKGAIGLMQLMPLTAAAFHVLDPFDPNENIRAGAALLRRLLDRFGGDLSLALAAYHAGETRVGQAVGLSSLSGTQLYVERVLRHYDRFVTAAHRPPARSLTVRREGYSVATSIPIPE